MKKSKQIIGKEQIKAAYKTLMSYRSAKEALDKRIIENENWFKLRCSEQSKTDDEIGRSSAWLFNSILNKHADAMDSFPEANILPREKSDKAAASVIKSILPVILEQRNFEQTYSDVWWYKLKTGTGVYGVFWNNELDGGLGDVDITQLDILNLFWEPGVRYIEQSSNVFYLNAVDKATLFSDYPNLKNQIEKDKLSLESNDLKSSLEDDSKVIVVDWYYKKRIKGKWVLHYCKFAGEALLFASENEERYRESGFYDHGKYPIVFDTMFVTEGSPAGFGYVDIMKGSQLSIDRLGEAIERNAIIGQTPRWFISDAAGINEEEYADWSLPFIHTTGRIDDQTVKQVSVADISSNALSLLEHKITELKETSGNRDFAQGSTNYGVTAASAIIALQEAAGKTTRDMLKSSFRAFSQICYLAIELIRQFYNEPRTFRITGKAGEYEYISFSGEELKAKVQPNIIGENESYRLPIFDIKIIPQKQNPYQKAQQNELAKELFSLGMLSPERKSEAAIAIKMMDFDGKEEVLNALKD